MSKIENIVITASYAAEAAWAKAISSYTGCDTPETLLHALRHPTLRHLLEVYLNGSVTPFGARVLKATGLVTFNKSTTRGTRSGKRVETVALTYLGKKSAIDIMRTYSGFSWFRCLVEGITAYACRDEGDGVCLTGNHLRAAFKSYDFDILERVVNPKNGEYQFQLGDASQVNEKMRLEVEGIWSPNYSGRKSAFIFVSTYELIKPTWQSDDYDSFISLSSIEDLMLVPSSEARVFP